MPTKSRAVEIDRPHRQPWDRLAGETAKQFQHFIGYRDQPASDRSIGALAKQKGMSHPGLRNLSAKFRWRERALAYDEYVDAIAQDRHIESTLEIRGRLLDLARRKIAKLTPDDFTPMDIVQMVGKIAPASKRVEHDVSLHRVDHAAESLPASAIDLLSEHVPPVIEVGTEHGVATPKPALLRPAMVEGGRK